jgi:hypothetical protein
VYVLWDINFYEVYLLIAKANLFYFFIAVLTMFVSFLVWNFRWTYTFRPVFKGDFGFLLHILFAGAFFNTVTPGAGIGGEPFRAHYLAKKYKKPRSLVFAYVLGDSFFKTAVLAFFIVFSVFFVLIFVKISSHLKLILELVLVFVIVMAAIILYLTFKKSHFKLGVLFKKLYFLRCIKKRFKTQEAFCEYLDTRMETFSKVFKKVVKNRNNLIVGISLSVVYWILHFLVAYFLFLSFDYRVNFLSVIIVFTLGEIIGNLSVAPGGIGVVETSTTLLFSAMGIPLALAFLVSFLTRVINYFFALVIGGWSLMKLRRLFNGNKFFLF